VPIFDKNRLLTRKYYNYELFKKALEIFSNNTLPVSTKHEMLLQLKSQIIPEKYMSPV
jgi:hypothetical protein